VLPPKRLTTGALDNLVKVWTFQDNKFVETSTMKDHTDWVRDVAWCNNIGLMYDMIASCSEDQTVQIFKKDPKLEGWKG
jgi:WD40 repeat protein